MDSIPDEVSELVRQRTEARAALNYALADELRDTIESHGFTVQDTPEGPSVGRKPSFDVLDPHAIVDRLAEPASLGFSLHLVFEGWVGDVQRFVAAFAATNRTDDVEIVVVDPSSGEGEAIEAATQPYPVARVLHLDRAVGWAAARNAGLKTSRGQLIALVDPSIEPTGDMLTPFEAAFADDSVGVAGPYGLITNDLREFVSSSGPDVHAIEGYLLVARRSAFSQGLIDERFEWYRNADLDLSFQIRADGLRARVVEVPVTRHQHRGWNSLGPDDRQRRSKKNHAVFYRRWQGRADLVRPLG